MQNWEWISQSVERALGRQADDPRFVAHQFRLVQYVVLFRKRFFGFVSIPHPEIGRTKVTQTAANSRRHVTFNFCHENLFVLLVDYKTNGLSATLYERCS